jgi:hypothetical protein
MKLEPARLSVVLEHLSYGGEVNYRGRRFVWLDDKKVRETDTHEYFIDGLANIAEVFTGSDMSTPDREDYVGTGMSLLNFVKLVDNLPKDEFLRILHEVKKRRG